MLYNYWLSPDKLGQFNLLNFNIQPIDSLVNVKQFDFNIIVNKEYDNEIPKGLILDKWNLNINKNSYNITSNFKLLNNEGKKVEETLNTIIKDNKVEIITPFEDLSLLGNDLCFLALLKDEALTIRCSSVLLNDTLYLFAGKSGAGKSTILREATKSLGSRASIISDDHLTMKINSGYVDAITPLWDEINIKFKGKKIRANKLVLFFMEDSCTRMQKLNNSFDKIIILAKHCVLFGFSYITNEKIINIIKYILENYDMYICPIKNYNTVLDYLKGKVSYND